MHLFYMTVNDSWDLVGVNNVPVHGITTPTSTFELHLHFKGEVWRNTWAIENLTSTRTSYADTVKILQPFLYHDKLKH